MIDCLYQYLRFERIIRVRAPPDHRPDIRTFVIDLARIAGFHPSKRQPLPGTSKLWGAWMHFKPALIFYRGMKQQENDKNTETASKTP